MPAKSPSPYPAANGGDAADAPADAVKAEPVSQGTPHVSVAGRHNEVAGLLVTGVATVLTCSMADQQEGK